ncbi:MAG: histidine triad nucleotide-binding protein [Candidatus Kerfeldbacteria bacterium RIFOXYA2_FULL_38_24]|uniref:Histidine triad nucleotide-binding protein n=1 Tax=Candidatus Kerfeldbacteria bacterium RIFOXYB2_FULL_38_14 TaxID=1798547 RepID=A0A1G2BHW4_9BACT|nr:MAG: histidine triad nucleotide-binding protein [Candidatus Kerfeldbacteria bacterium RIFOXYA2_FULL_38_24]OGY88266.1 MAG: histidine triad nucleotide-binding protein [Candidatus Kerfeldbacteria bacterium RIFOXYB2_FULL_38_14]OGY89389.1 MAG: histidine triad nucleotide-binding protein [Candidatus Kerfeldbacteria bacterium RIFOXYC2_FULL_38_9]
MDNSSSESIFTKIINREATADIVYEDEEMIAIKDINPKAPVHILLLPKDPIKNLNDFTQTHTELLGRLMLKAAEIAKKLNIADTGYKIVINTGDHGGQIIDHFHLHILGGQRVKAVV